MKTKLIIAVVALISVFNLNAQRLWNLEKDGSISFTVSEKSVHSDDIEMSGRFISVISGYGVTEQGELILNNRLYFPMLRTIPNDTRGFLSYNFGSESMPAIKINNRPIREQVIQCRLRGILTIYSLVNRNITIKRELYPSVDKPLAILKYTVINTSGRDISVDVEDIQKIFHSHKEKSVYGAYEVSARVSNAGIFEVGNHDSISFALVYSGRKLSDDPVVTDIDQELTNRIAFVNTIFDNLCFISPDTVLNRMFDFAKIRAMESIFETKGGLVHSPGGGEYYAAIWANDQAEYANPFFAYSGYPIAVEAGMTSWRWFAKYMNPEFKPIPSSIIAEGTSYWNGAGDRGDQAMIAYGASRFALAYGNRDTAREIWPLITWCLEYLDRKKNREGVIPSNSDELEGRFPAGDINLSTNVLAYGAYISAACLANELGLKDAARNYNRNAAALRIAIEKYFGANVMGFDTYRYYDGNTKLRSWICLPLCMGIYDRKKETIKALLSDYLWSKNGILTESGSTTYWDRSTLYAFRGLFASGETDTCLAYFDYYSSQRLLGEHVPYPVEAWPEGNQRHLSAESALYCRVITEGLFRIVPTGFNEFTVNPILPEKWDEMKLTHVKAFGHSFDLTVSRAGKKEIVAVKLLDGSLIEKTWDMKSPLKIILP